ADPKPISSGYYHGSLLNNRWDYRTLTLKLSEAALKGVADTQAVAETYSLNDVGLHRKISLNRQVAESLLFQLIELRRSRNTVLKEAANDKN
ncbi:hypothetical protein, partial [Salinimonas profundi]|uniref:hypothetical protein n=1 Tax=Salinimonas profundi TaxID=2729140 RepID=UPI001CC2E1E0